MQAALDIRNRGEKFMELIVAKQRNGDVGTIYLAYEGARTRFKNIELWREEDGVGRQKQK
jgi:replicative DNA helicase